jgi:CRISPR-associated protein Cmr4
MATLYNTYFIHCLSAVHVGDGSSTGTIDLPIQREKVTGFPIFRDSSLRGAIRSHFEEDTATAKDEHFIPTFGNRDNGDSHSALEVFPAHLLFFPVRSYKGLFAWVTCPYILKRYQAASQKFGTATFDYDFPTAIADQHIYATEKLIIGNSSKVGLEEFLFEAQPFEAFSSLATYFAKATKIERLATHCAMVSDSVFGYMARLFTEKVTRNKIDIETGVAADGALFNEEFLPEQCVLYTTLGFSNEFSKKENRKKDHEIQKYVNENVVGTLSIGGDKSIGKGLIEILPANNQ